MIISRAVQHWLPMIIITVISILVSVAKRKWLIDLETRNKVRVWDSSNFMNKMFKQIQRIYNYKHHKINEVNDDELKIHQPVKNRKN